METNDTNLITKTITEFIFYRPNNTPIKISLDALLDYSSSDKIRLDVPKSANVKGEFIKFLVEKKIR